MNDSVTPHLSPLTRRPLPRQSDSILLKMGTVAVLVLVLLIPLMLIRSVLSERLDRRDAALSEIKAAWGDEQAVAGPVLIVPYRSTRKVWKEHMAAGRVERVEVEEQTVARAVFLPATLEAEGELQPDTLYRGIYRAVVYRGRLTLSGEFRPPVFDAWKVAPSDILWEDALVALAVTDLRGAQGALMLQWGDRELPLEPGPQMFDLNGVESRLKLAQPPGENVPFRIELTLKGSRGLRLAPMGESNRIRLVSSWPDPSFQGAFLPTERTVTPEGFEALWQTTYYGRGYPQQWSEREGEMPMPVRPSAIGHSLLGVDLLAILDAYRFVERSIKYGVLFIALVFTAFFLFEVLARTRVHPFQYTLVGVALCLFYLALLSLSEFMAFGTAYLVGAAVSTVMIAWYSAAALRSGSRSALLGAGIAAIYGFLYVILRLQDYSLLLGTIGLFVVLGLVMAATRRIDWYARGNE